MAFISQTTVFMKPALRYQHQAPPAKWQDFPLGEEIKNAIDGHLQLWWPKFFGYHLLKIGNLSCDLDSSTCQISHQVGVAESSDKAGVVADIDELPFFGHSVDAVVLSHCLEFFPDPHHLIREADRVLIPDGHLVITGFNPVSLCGLAKMAHFNSEKFPWCGRFFNAARIKDWLSLLGFEVLEDKRLMFNSLARQKGYKPHSWWQTFATKYFSYFGSVYIIVARKRELPLTPIKPEWRARPAFNPATIKNALKQSER